MIINIINYLNSIHLDGEAIVVCGSMVFGYVFYPISIKIGKKFNNK